MPPVTVEAQAIPNFCLPLSGGCVKVSASLETRRLRLPSFQRVASRRKLQGVWSPWQRRWDPLNLRASGGPQEPQGDSSSGQQGEDGPRGPPETEPGEKGVPDSSPPEENQSSAAAQLEAASSLAVPLPRSVVETLRDQVFGFDTFFVTGQEPYQGGVLFQGNLRGDPAAAFRKIEGRLKERFGDTYLLYLLESPSTERPVAVVVPADSVLPPPPAIPDWLGASAFGAVTILTALLTSSPPPEFGFIPSWDYLLGPLLEGVPAAGVFLLGLLAHEAGHLLVARQSGLQLAIPYFIPSWQLGSFGAITRVLSVMPDRTRLVNLAAAGPLAGGFLSLVALLVSLAVLRPDPAFLPEGAAAIILDYTAFQDSLLVGSLARLVLGSELAEGAKVAVSPITIAAWSSLLVNAINAIPTGELDGGRIAVGLFGRKWANRLSFVALGLLGLTGIFNDVALFWLVLVIFLQRGPVPPQQDELSSPSDGAKLVGALALVFGFLVYCPLPVPL